MAKMKPHVIEIYEFRGGTRLAQLRYRVHQHPIDGVRQVHPQMMALVPVEAEDEHNAIARAVIELRGLRLFSSDFSGVIEQIRNEGRIGEVVEAFKDDILRMMRP